MKFQLTDEFILLLPDHAGTGPRSGRTDLAQNNYFRIGVMLQDQSFDLGMRHGSHEAAADHRDGFAVERGKTRRLFDFCDGALSHG